MKNKGFSLLELLIVVAIMGLIASVAVPKYLKNMNKARWETSKAELKRVAEAFDQYNLDYGYYPEYATWDEIATSENILIKEGYIDRIPLKDKFSRKYEGFTTKDDYLFVGLAAPNEKFASEYHKYYIKEGNFLTEEQYQELMAARENTTTTDEATEASTEGDADTGEITE